MTLTKAEKKLKRAFEAKPLSEQQRLMIEAVNREMDEADPEPDTYAPNLNVSPLALHIRVINYSLWSMHA